MVVDPTVVGDDHSLFCHDLLLSALLPHCFLFKPLASKRSYHYSIYQKTSLRLQKSSSSLGKFDGMLYLPLLCMLLRHGNDNFVVLSVSFVAKCPQDASFVIEACHYEHWLL
jgi:hypothetical protein